MVAHNSKPSLANKQAMVRLAIADVRPSLAIDESRAKPGHDKSKAKASSGEKVLVPGSKCQSRKKRQKGRHSEAHIAQ